MKNQVSTCTYLSALVFSLLFIVGCDTAVITGKAKDPTHKIVCSCICGQGTDHSELQTFEQPSAGCSSLDGIACKPSKGGVSTLTECAQKAVPTSALEKLSNKPIQTVEQ